MRQLKISQKITNRESEALERYLSDVSREPTITADEEVALAKQIKQGSTVAFDRLVKANLRFVVSVAKQYQNNGLTLNDLINEGNIGLLKAAKRFDETKGFKFITYAVWWIRQSILQAVVENSRMIRLPHNKSQLIKQINHAFQSFLQENDREPTNEELAELFNVDVETIAYVIQSGLRHTSLDEPIGDEGNSGVAIDLIVDEHQQSPDFHLMDESLKNEFKIIMRSLAPREREVISKLYGINGEVPKSLEEVAYDYSLSIERTRQIRDLAIRRLRQAFKRSDFKPDY